MSDPFLPQDDLKYQGAEFGPNASDKAVKDITTAVVIISGRYTVIVVLCIFASLAVLWLNIEGGSVQVKWSTGEYRGPLAAGFLALGGWVVWCGRPCFKKK